MLPVILSPDLAAVFGVSIVNPDPSITFQVISDTHIDSISQFKLDDIVADQPITPSFILHAGDITNDGTSAQQTKALTFLGRLPSTWYIVNGGHDVLVYTPAQVATTYGMAGQNYTVDLGFCVLIVLGMDTPSSGVISATQRTFLENSLAGTAKQCVVLCHMPLFYTVLNDNTTDYFDSRDMGIANSLQIRSILALHDNAVAWISGHAHSPLSSVDVFKTELVGAHNMAMISVSSPYYTKKGATNVAAEPIITVYVTVGVSGIQVRARDHLNKRWAKQTNIPLATGLIEPSPSFLMTFGTDAAAPLPSFVNADVGVLQTGQDSVMAISGGLLAVNGTPAAKTQINPVEVMYRKCGRALRVDVPTRSTMSNAGLSIALSDYASVHYGHIEYNTTVKVWLRAVNNATLVSDTIANNSHSFILAMRDTGTFCLWRDSASPANVYRLLWVFKVGTMALVPTILDAAASENYTIDNMKVEMLTGGFLTQYGLATARTAITADGDTLTGTADAIVEHTITAQTDVTQELSVRRVDDNNRIVVRMDQTNSLIKVLTRISGTEVEKVSAAFTWTNGTQYRIVVIMDGTAVQVLVDDVSKYSNTITSLTTNTGVKVSHAGADLVIWPRTVTVP
jgi:hypothetical protein